MARNLHRGFHDIYEPSKGAIERHEARKKREADQRRRDQERASAAPVPTAKHGLRGE